MLLFFLGNEYCSLEYCWNNYTGEGKDKDKYDIQDLYDEFFFCHLFCLLNLNSSIVIFELKYVIFDGLSYPQAPDSLDQKISPRKIM